MLKVCANLNLQLHQKVKLKSRVLRFCKVFCAIILFCCMMSGSVFAYTVSTSGATSVYTWELPTIKSIIPYSIPATLPEEVVNIGFRANYNGQNVYWGGSLPDTSTTSNRVGYVDVSEGITPSVRIFSTGKEVNVLNVKVSNVAQITLSSISSETLTLTDSYYSFDVSFNTIFDFLNGTNIVGSTLEERLNTFVNICRIYIFSPSGDFITLNPSKVTTSPRQVRVVHGDGYDNVEGEYVDYYYTQVQFLVENKLVESLEVDRVQLVIPVQCGTTMNYDMYWRQDISFSPINMSVLSRSAFESQETAIYQNNNLISQLGTINTVDQDMLNSQKSEFDKVSEQTSQLAGASEFSEGLLSDFDVTQEVDILNNSDYINSVQNVWDVFPFGKEFFTTALVMIGSISILSLILHAGDRSASIFASDRHSDKTWQRHRDMAKKQNQSNNKSGGK